MFLFLLLWFMTYPKVLWRQINQHLISDSMCNHKVTIRRSHKPQKGSSTGLGFRVGGGPPDFRFQHMAEKYRCSVPHDRSLYAVYTNGIHDHNSGGLLLPVDPESLATYNCCHGVFPFSITASPPPPSHTHTLWRLGQELIINMLIEKQRGDSSTTASNWEKGNVFRPRNSELFWAIPFLESP